MDPSQAEIVAKSAELRLDNALREFKRQMFGDEAWLQELDEEDRGDRAALLEPGPGAEVRRKLKRRWVSFWKG